MEPVRRRFAEGVDLRHFLALFAGLGLLAGVALPAWFSQARVTLDGAARLLVRDLRTAQNLAVVEAVQLHVVFEPGGYRVERSDGELALNPRTDQPFARRWPRDAVFRGVHLDEVDLEGSERVTFDRFGYVQPGGRLVLAFGGSERHVLIDAPRGLFAIAGLSEFEHDDGR